MMIAVIETEVVMTDTTLATIVAIEEETAAIEEEILVTDVITADAEHAVENVAGPFLFCCCSN